VEEIPWPSAQDRRDALTGGESPAPRPRGGGGGLFGGGARQRAAAAAAEEDDDVAVDDGAVQHTREAARPRTSGEHPRSKKRKRKRR
jgi:hypothetical protein